MFYLMGRTSQEWNVAYEKLESRMLLSRTMGNHEELQSLKQVFLWEPETNMA
jgi:hypothetical protein